MAAGPAAFWSIPETVSKDFLMLAGGCSDGQQCNADNRYFKNYETSLTPSATGLLGYQDSAVGVCITPVAAGLPCRPGTGESLPPDTKLHMLIQHACGLQVCNCTAIAAASISPLVYEAGLPVCLQTCAADLPPMLARGAQPHPAHEHDQALSANPGQVSSTYCAS